MIAFCELRDTEHEYFQQQFGEEHIYTSEELGSQLDNPEQIDTVSVFVNSAVSGEIIDYYPNLEHITTRSTGYDHIDVEYAKERDIVVSHVPAYGSESVAEYAFALLLSLVRNVHTGYHHTRERGEFRLDGLRGMALAGKTIGIIGTGAIGSHAVQIADGFGIDIQAYDPEPKEQLVENHGVSYIDELATLLGSVDIVSLHVPLNKHTHHLIDSKALETMKDSAYLINTARGGVVDTTALVEAIDENQIAGAGLDVLEEESRLNEEKVFTQHSDAESAETLLADHILIDRDNVIVTPHIGFYTKDAEREIMDTTAENIKTYFDTGQPANQITL